MKHPLTISTGKSGLLVIDMQEKFAPVIPGFGLLAHNIAKLILTFQMFKMPVLVLEQYPKGLGRTVDKIRRQFPQLEVIEKTEFAGTESAQFWSRLTPLDLDTIVVTGVETHVCVNQTALGLLQRGFRVHVVADAVGSRFTLDHDVALRKMEQAGTVPATTEMVLFEIAQRAGTQQFKYIQQMVKPSASSAAAMTGKPASTPSPVTGTAKQTAKSDAVQAKPREVLCADPGNGAAPQAPLAEVPSFEEKTVEGEVEELLGTLPEPETLASEDLTVDLDSLIAAEIPGPGVRGQTVPDLDTKKIRIEFSGGEPGNSPEK